MNCVGIKLSERSMLRFAWVVLAVACVGLGPAIGQEKTQDQTKSTTSETSKSGQPSLNSSSAKTGQDKTGQKEAGQDEAGKLGHIR